MRKINKKRLLLVIVTGLILICLLAFGIVKGISYVMDNSKPLELVGNEKTATYARFCLSRAWCKYS